MYCLLSPGTYPIGFGLRYVRNLESLMEEKAEDLLQEMPAFGEAPKSLSCMPFQTLLHIQALPVRPSQGFYATCSPTRAGLFAGGYRLGASCLLEAIDAILAFQPCYKKWLLE